jgi:hypothetical protein
VAAALLLGLVVVLGGWAFSTPRAAADPAVTVYVRDLTPPVVSVDANGTVTFINQIADKTVAVKVGLATVNAVVHTDVTLNLPSGSHAVQPSAQAPPNQPQPTAKQLKPEQSWTEKFTQTCATCTISYSYRVDNASLLGLALPLLPQLPAVPTPFVVNTILPLPNLPGVNVPQLPQININVPKLPSQLPKLPNGQVTIPGQQTVTTTTTTTTTTLQGGGGAQAAYSMNGVSMAPNGNVAVPAFDPSQGNGQGSGSAGSSENQIGSPQLANRGDQSPFSSRYSLPALLALISVAGVGTWWVRTFVHRFAVDR